MGSECIFTSYILLIGGSKYIKSIRQNSCFSRKIGYDFRYLTLRNEPLSCLLNHDGPESTIRVCRLRGKLFNKAGETKIVSFAEVHLSYMSVTERTPNLSSDSVLTNSLCNLMVMMVS